MEFFKRATNVFSELKEQPRAVLSVKLFLVAVVMVTAFLVRMDTFWLPNVSGDQLQHAALAMKLDAHGFRDGFSLRGVRSGSLAVGLDEDLEEDEAQVLVFAPTEDPDRTGDVIRMLKKIGASYYDQPFFHKPPAFPYAIMLSHRIFSPAQGVYSLLATNLGEEAVRQRPPEIFESQFYAALVPLFFGLGAVLLTFILGLYLFDFRVGLYSALIYALHPITILMDQRLLSDSMVSFFIVLAMLLFVIARDKDLDWFYLFSGISCGIAVLAKQTGGYFLIAVLIFTVLSDRYSFKELKNVPRILCNKAFFYTALGVFLVSGFWFFEIYRLFGNPLWRPRLEATPDEYANPWFFLLRSRPHGIIFFTAGIPFLGPPMLAAYFTLKKFAKEFALMLKKKVFDPRFVFLWMVILLFGFMLRSGGEHRRLMPVYPFIAVMASYAFDRFRIYSGRFSEYLGNRYVREVAIIVFFILSSFWMVRIGREATLANEVIITIPF